MLMMLTCCKRTGHGHMCGQPKHANSITKREVLRKSLGLDKAAAYYKKQNPTAESLPSTLELWVIHQMAKLNAAPDTGGPAQVTVGLSLAGGSPMYIWQQQDVSRVIMPMRCCDA